MDGKEITKLAGELSAGTITTAAISAAYGPGVLSAVLGIAGGVVAGSVAGSLIDMIDRETGIVSDIGSVVDDIFSIF